MGDGGYRVENGKKCRGKEVLGWGEREEAFGQGESWLCGEK